MAEHRLSPRLPGNSLTYGTETIEPQQQEWQRLELQELKQPRPLFVFFVEELLFLIARQQQR
jgi:hypothetical protein